MIWADVPDIAMIRVGKTYYVSSTTMHACPGIPIMESTDVVNWRMASYAYDTLADNEAFRLENGKDGVRSPNGIESTLSRRHRP